MRFDKIQLATDISKSLESSEYIYFVSYKGLKVDEFSELRDELAKTESECHVYKNRIIKKAAELVKLEEIANMELIEDTAVVTGVGDPSATAKVIKNFAKSHNVLSVKKGYYDGEMLTKEDVEELADLPTKEVLQSLLLGVLEATPRNFVSVLNTKVTTIVNVLNAYKDKLEEK